jgi:hypothetical protein
MEDRGNKVSVNANSSANAGNNNIDERGIPVGDGRLQNQGEHDGNKHTRNSGQDNEVSASDVGQQQVEAEAAGSDRGGTGEQKEYGDTELNKGLESQVQDREDA